MKLIIDIMELYENTLEIPGNDEQIFKDARIFIENKYFPQYDAELLVKDASIEYVFFGDEVIKDIVAFNVIPAI